MIRPWDHWFSEGKRWAQVVVKQVNRVVDSLSFARAPDAPEPIPSPVARPRVAGVLDLFSQSCLDRSCALISPRPRDYRRVLSATSLDFLLAESAFAGNGGSWRYRLEWFVPHLGNELEGMIRLCQRRGIPTVFWNKDDPVHFERFVESARLFDFVFTTDALCIPSYRERLGHARVFALPFAAQPALHHPILEGKRAQNVCFAGSYWNDRYAHRRREIDVLLGPALDFGLHIYDRNFDLRGLRARKWRFPEAYRPAIQGKLHYRKMVEAYKHYQVFLNVNSVPSSPTMFSRRVFELMACGTPVVSAWARGIEDVLGTDAVLFSSSEAETRQHLERLLEDDDFWARRSLLGIRKVMGEHTYASRLRAVCAQIGIDPPEGKQTRVALLARVRDEGEVRGLVASLQRQRIQPQAVFLLVEPDRLSACSALAAQAATLGHWKILPWGRASDPQALLSALRKDSEWVWIYKPGNYYGSHYLEDYLLATRYADRPVLGKHAHFRQKGDGTLALTGQGTEHCHVARVPSASAFLQSAALDRGLLTKLWNAEWLSLEPDGCLALDRFHFVRGTRGEGVLPEEGFLKQVEC